MKYTYVGDDINIYEFDDNAYILTDEEDQIMIDEWYNLSLDYYNMEIKIEFTKGYLIKNHQKINQILSE